ncbi:RNA polymerase sigma factor [Ornithinibacillus scapharcae]|uniref:RNA polymerase sigma factor n=1 Tax=Ornithinibacillus scapharcae TaxID=1147159 RepID=UPI000225BA5E|nr:sigma-70 family RNA polymerase sigma factor [Ornithinibacillus scapharcae]
MGQQLEDQVKILYAQYHNEIFTYILLMIGERQQAKDLMQDTFVKVFINWERFRGQSSPKTWIYHIARNVTIDYIRKKHPVSYYLDYYSPIHSKQPTPEESLELNEDIALLHRALLKLNRPTRDVIVLRKIMEFSIKETALVLDWKESRVKTVLHRGLEALRKELVEEGFTNETV